MTGRAKLALGALAACAVGVGGSVPAGGQSADVGGYAVVFEYARGDARGIVHAFRRPGGAAVRVSVSLHGLEPRGDYEVAATRARCTGRVLWRASFSTPAGEDDTFARLRVPLDPSRATGAGGAGLYLVAPDGSRKLVACAAGRRYGG